MKIAFWTDAAFPWHMGGLEAVERTEAEELAKKYDVDFVSIRWPGMQSDFVDKGIRYHTIMRTTKEKFYRHGRRSIRTSIWYAMNSLKIFFHKYDVIEANMFPILQLPILKLYCKLTGCKLILDVVEVWSKDYWKDYLGDFMGRIGYRYATYFIDSADAYITNSSETAEKLHTAGNVDWKRINVFAPILDDKTIAKAKSRKEGMRIIFWGRLIKEKRFDKWLAVVKEVHKKMPLVRAVLIGEGPERDNIIRMIKSMGLQKVVSVRPGIDDRLELYKEVSKSAVCLHMSEREGLGLVALESIALGVPVVLPSYSPIADEVKGMCVVEDEKEVAGKLIEILKSKRPDTYIKRRETLLQFEVSRTLPFYESLFRKLGLR